MDGAQPDEMGQQAWDAGSWRPEVGPGRAVWRPAAGYGRLVGALFTAGLAAIAILALLLLVQDDGAIRIVWLILLGLALAGIATVVRLLRGLSSLRYVFTEDHLRVEWQRSVRRIPYHDMLEVVYHLREHVELPGRESYWPGFRISTVRTRGGVWHSYATVPPHRRIRITTPSAVIAISPERPILFIQELERRRIGQPADVSSELQPGRPRRAVARQPSRRPGMAQTYVTSTRQSIAVFRNELLTDRIASTLVAIGVIIPVFMLAYTFNEVDFLPDRIPLHWNAQGEADRFGSSNSIWSIPLLALTVLVVNSALATLVLPIDRVAARLIVAVTPVVQLATALALWRIIN